MKKLIALGIAAPFIISLSCSQIVGITDTDVTRAAGGAADSGASGSSPGASGKNAAGAGQGGGSSGNAAAGSSVGGDDTPQAGAMSAGGISAGGTSAGGTSSGMGGNGGGAPVLHGPKLINVGTYSVDATEVTVGQYKEFLTAKKGDTSGQAKACTWNKSFYDAAPMPLEGDMYPIAKVDWCDASAFCDWAGKRLCGAIAGGPLAPGDFIDETKSQWYRACGGPLGGTHPNDQPDCNEKGGADFVKPVATFPGCEGFFPGVFDMEGNVAEWIDSCDDTSGNADHCTAAGGSELTNIAYCTQADDSLARDFTSAYFGFRCCSK